MKLHFILNTTAKTGGASSIWKEIAEILMQEHINFEVHQTTYKGAASDIAGQLSSSPEEKVYLIAIGGDGTLNEILNGITDFDKVRLGIIPAGSGNDFVRGTGLRSGVAGFRAILESIRKEEHGHALRRMDLGEASFSGQTRLFGISAGIGLDAIVCKKALTSKLKRMLNRLHLGQLTYLLLTVQTLFSMKTAEVEITSSENENTRHVRKLIFAAAMNLYAEGGGVPMAPKADPYDGSLSLSMAYGIPKAVTFFCLPFLVAGKQTGIPGFSITASGSYSLHTDRPMTLHLDGEYGGEVTDVTFTCRRGALALLGTETRRS